jgi:phosphate uptake regulator
MDVGLSSRTGLSLATVMSCMGVSKILERMGDHAVLIVKNLSSQNDADRKIFADNLDTLSGSLLGYIGGSMESWMNADYILAESIIRSKKDVQAIARRSFADFSDKDAGNLLRGSIARIIDYCSDIAESAINVAMAKSH